MWKLYREGELMKNLHLYSTNKAFMKRKTLGLKTLSLLGITAGVFLSSCNPKTESQGVEETKPKVTPAFDLSSLDTTVSPCDNFYQFTAGGWIEANPIPETESRWGKFNQLIENNNERLKTLLDSFSGDEQLEKGTDEQLIGDLYYSGMDSATIEGLGITTIQPLLSRVEEVSDKAALPSLFLFLSNGVASVPFNLGVSPDSKFSTKNALYLSQSGLSLPDQSYYLKSDSAAVAIQKAYREHVAKMHMLLGIDSAEAVAISNRIYGFESKLAGEMMGRVERRNPANTYNKFAASEVIEFTQNLNIAYMMKELKINPDSIIVRQPDYIKFLDALIMSEDLQTWKDYSRWKVVRGMAAYLPMEFVRENFKFYGTTLSGAKEMKPRWKRILAATNGLSEQLGHLYVQAYFSEEDKQVVEEMVENLRSAYGDRIRQLDWMSDVTKEKALEKLSAFTYKIGYPNKWKDFSDLEISRGSFLENVVNISKYKTALNFDKLDRPVDKDDWFMGAHIVNAYYNPTNNEVVFPAGILQPPFYNPNADDAINYGAIGGVIGHEFTHGFDDQGSKYGPNGNLSNWWTEKDREAFDELAKRMIDQYSAYEPLPGVNVNGALTIGENIADHGGLTLAYYAYQNSRKGKGPAPEVDGYTGNQRVFLGWAQVWQSHATEAYTKRQVETDPHSPGEYRVVGPMSNMVEFMDAWNCESGAMVKQDSKRIVIW